MIHDHVEFYNVSELIPDAETGALRLCRIPDGVRTGLNRLGKLTAFNACGVELRFRQLSPTVKLRLRLSNPEEFTEGRAVALVYYGCFEGPAVSFISAAVTELEIKKPENLETLRHLSERLGSPYAADLVRVVLPHSARLEWHGLEGELSPPAREQAPERKWLAYGSSITQGGNALRPTGTYAMRTAGSLGVDIHNLGFGGSALLDGVMADYIASRTDWEFATLELGINMVWNIEENKPGEPEHFRKQVDYFIEKIARTHRDKWIFCLDMFRYSGDWNEDPIGKAFRSIVRDKVEELRLPKLVYLDGRDLLPDYCGLTSDLIHPSEEGMFMISERLAAAIRNYMDTEEGLGYEKSNVF